MTLLRMMACVFLLVSVGSPAIAQPKSAALGTGLGPSLARTASASMAGTSGLRFADRGERRGGGTGIRPPQFAQHAQAREAGSSSLRGPGMRPSPVTGGTAAGN